ncbi:MAG: hypothetical protein Q4G03_00380 [Planctomycetia bacterium]|nr:hypothetical protein [Planctomycetia bacterium]
MTGCKKSPNLLLRAFAFALYGGVVWGAIFQVNRARLQLPEKPLIALALVWSATILATFLVIAILRRLRKSGLPEYLVAATARSAVPCCAALVGVASMQESMRRPFLMCVLVAYFALAPVALWLTFPPEGLFTPTNASEAVPETTKKDNLPQ